jgi:glycosyltransferase involved in cell wall biosynthesis
VLVGGDSYELSHEYAQSLTPLVDSLGLKDSVTMTGEVPDAGPYMEQMDILVNASDPEPFGNVIVEGMARKVPVVAVNSGGPGEYLDNDRTAMLAATNRPEDLADALEPLLASESKRAELAVAGHELFMREFTEVAMRRRWFECLESVRDGRPRGVPLGAAQPATTS